MVVEEKHRAEEKSVNEDEDEGLEDVTELVRATGELIDKIKELAKEIIETTMRELDGAKLGREVGELYRSLREAGISEEEAMAMAKQFFQSKLEAVPKLQSLLEALGEKVPGKSTIIVPGQGSVKKIDIKKIAEKENSEENEDK